jgi:hypothetical protein
LGASGSVDDREDGGEAVNRKRRVKSSGVDATKRLTPTCTSRRVVRADTLHVRIGGPEAGTYEIRHV